MPLFYELAFFFGISGVFGFLANRLGQPSIVGYIVSGIVAKALFFGSPGEEIEIFSKIGIVFLLFAVGLHLNPEVLRQTGKKSLMAGFGQIAFTFLAALLFTHSMYVAIALTFSSTIVVIKALSDKRDLEKLYAKIAIGILIVQDIVASFILLFGNIDISSGADLNTLAIDMIIKVCILSILLLILSKWVLPVLFKKSAESSEVLFLLSVAWGLGVASIFSLLNLSLEIGALLAGVTLSSTNFAQEIGARIKPVRDMFLVLFFVLLGMQIDISLILQIFPKAIVLSAFVLIGGPLLTWLVLRLLGQSNKVSLLTGFTMAQVSEFSLILMQSAKNSGNVSHYEVALVTVVMTITIVISSYMMQHSERLYELLLPVLRKVFPSKKNEIEKYSSKGYKIALFGHDRVGEDFLNLFKKMKKDFFIVDHNPKIIEGLLLAGHAAFYGDAEDAEFLDTLPNTRLALVVSTIPELGTNILLCKYFTRENDKISFVGLAHTKENAQKLYNAGASYVIMPHYLGARHAVRIIHKANTVKDRYLGLRNRHLKRLNLSSKIKDE